MVYLVHEVQDTVGTLYPEQGVCEETPIATPAEPKAMVQLSSLGTPSDPQS